MPRNANYLRLSRIGGAGAFTLIELLVVMAIITILASATFYASTAVLNRGKAHKTEFVLKIVNDALEAYRREQPSILAAKQGPAASYLTRYGPYPPDEWEPFTHLGIPGCDAGGPGQCRSLIPGGGDIVPRQTSGDYPPMLFEESTQPEYEHRDISAMILGIQLFGDASNSILSGVPQDQWVDGPFGKTGAPLQYLDRDGDNAWDPSQGDEQLRYIVDAWNVPLAYFNERDFVAGSTGSTATQSSNTPDWNENVTAMVALNKGKPIVMSYGPNGRDQLKREVLEPTPQASLIGDFTDNKRIDESLNQDNIYADPELKLRLADGIPKP